MHNNSALFPLFQEWFSSSVILSLAFRKHLEVLRTLVSHILSPVKPLPRHLYLWPCLFLGSQFLICWQPYKLKESYDSMTWRHTVHEIHSNIFTYWNCDQNHTFLWDEWNIIISFTFWSPNLNNADPGQYSDCWLLEDIKYFKLPDRSCKRTMDTTS